MNNPWHTVKLGNDTPYQLQAIIEVPKGSKIKYELDKESGLIKVDRILFSSVHYPANYGFFPQTYCGDHDPLDVLVLGQEPVMPLSIMLVKPIGLMKMIDQGEEDDKVIAVHVNDPEYTHYEHLDDLPPHRMQEIKRFFEDYKRLEHKEVSIEAMQDKDQAHACIMKAMEDYRCYMADHPSKSAREKKD